MGEFTKYELQLLLQIIQDKIVLSDDEIDLLLKIDQLIKKMEQ